jgi:DNA-binding NarL/FixJ family response regulator
MPGPYRVSSFPPISPNVTTVFACDSEPVAIEGLRSLLESGDGLRLVAAGNSLQEAMRAIAAWHPALAVIDKAFGLDEVMDCLRTLRDSPGAPRIVVWGGSISSSEAVRLMRAGAGGVIRKTASLKELMECIDSVARGGSWIEDDVIAAAGPALVPSRRALTGRELQVVELVERGLTNKSIARELGISIGTVKIHLRHIFEKTGIHGRYGLALSGLRARLPESNGISVAVGSVVSQLT